MAAPQSQKHPPARQLERFLRGEASRTERLAIVRHLLAGCQQCAAVMRPVFHPGDRLLADGPVQSMDSLEGVR